MVENNSFCEKLSNEAKSENEMKYIESFSEKERKAYQIAESHLGSSFSLKKSKGFLEFCKNSGIK